jgi:hypothetical protein
LGEWHRFDRHDRTPPLPEHPAFEQPFFDVRSLSMAVEVKSGATCILGSATDLKKGTVSYFFFSAQIEPVRPNLQQRTGPRPDDPRKHIETTASTVEFKTPDIELLARENRVDGDALYELWRQGKGKLIGTTVAITHPGETNGVSRNVVEQIYPTQFTVATQPGPDGETELPCAGTVVEPGGFQTREVGSILQVSPDLVSGDRIQLTMNPQVVRLREWREFLMKRWRDTGAGSLGGQPFFGVNSVSSSVVLTNGATVLLGGATDETKFGRSTYTFVTARFIGADGLPVTPKTTQRDK